MKSAAPAFNKRAQRKRLRRSAGPGVKRAWRGVFLEHSSNLVWRLGLGFDSVFGVEVRQNSIVAASVLVAESCVCSGQLGCRFVPSGGSQVCFVLWF